jgi:hypothetical protein
MILAACTPSHDDSGCVERRELARGSLFGRAPESVSAKNPAPAMTVGQALLFAKVAQKDLFGAIEEKSWRRKKPYGNRTITRRLDMQPLACAPSSERVV